jgi:hypothetical protein
MARMPAQYPSILIFPDLITVTLFDGKLKAQIHCNLELVLWL